MKWMYYPKNKTIPEPLKSVINVFETNESKISSHEQTLQSDEVLAVLKTDLESNGFIVEKDKTNTGKIKIPVTYGENGIPELTFEADAFNVAAGIVVEVEAGRAVTNYQFLKDFFEACCMLDAEYLCIAVREIYRKNRDYKKVIDFFNSMYLSERFKIPLKGILIIGY